MLTWSSERQKARAVLYENGTFWLKAHRDRTLRPEKVLASLNSKGAAF